MKRIFLDMDGVLCDYYAGICRAFGVASPWPYLCPLGDWNFYPHPPLSLTTEQVAAKMDREFYAGLDWLPDGREIVRRAMDAVGSHNVYLLTSPWDMPGCDEGKRDWVKRYMPDFKRRTLIGACKEACAYPGAVLFDDSPANCEKFEAAGGVACLVARPWNRLHGQCSLQTGRALDLAEMFRVAAGG